MMDKELQKLIKIIEDPQYVVMWNDGKDSFHILKRNIYEEEGELKVFFKNFRKGFCIDLYNTTLIDLKIFKELEIGDI